MFRVFGANGNNLCQVPRIINGLIQNHAIQHDSDYPFPDSLLIYSNDPSGYESAFNYQKEYGGKVILNILDCPKHVPEFNDWINKNKPFLLKADAVTTISFSAQIDVKKYFGIDTTVIYNPIKEIGYWGYKRFNTFLFTGRANDANKRFNLIHQTLDKIHGDNTILVAGPERPMSRYSKYLGVVSDSELNYLYNISAFLLYPSCFDGLGLPPIEMLVSGGIPILCNDSPTSVELFPDYLLCDPNPDAILNKVIEISKNYGGFAEKLNNLRVDYYNKFQPWAIGQNILKVYKGLA